MNGDDFQRGRWQGQIEGRLSGVESDLTVLTKAFEALTKDVHSLASSVQKRDNMAEALIQQRDRAVTTRQAIFGFIGASATIIGIVVALLSVFHP